MNVRFRPWHLAILVVLLCAGVIATIELIRIRSSSGPPQLVRHLPEGEGVVLYIDLSTLRDGGLLDLLLRAEVEEESEYRRFVRDTGFDYAEDLDGAAVAFHPGETFLVLQGRFRWGRLVDYAEERGGDCYNGFCKMPGSEPNREISFFALSPMVLAMAVSRDPWAALTLSSTGHRELAETPEAPLWMMMSGKALKRSAWLPAGTRSFVSAMEDAGLVTLSVEPNDTDFEARLKVDCDSETQAQELTAQMETVTGMLRNLIRRENKEPNPRDLSGVLTAGEFHCQGKRVQGRWPISRAFLEAATTGSN
ncbi:MAG: hypothetical protein GY953_35545 [bacterium]|nr:hypothetical protein [bacterium]